MTSKKALQKLLHDTKKHSGCEHFRYMLHEGVAGKSRLTILSDELKDDDKDEVESIWFVIMHLCNCYIHYVLIDQGYEEAARTLRIRASDKRIFVEFWFAEEQAPLVYRLARFCLKYAYLTAKSFKESGVMVQLVPSGIDELEAYINNLMDADVGSVAHSILERNAPHTVSDKFSRRVEEMRAFCEGVPDHLRPKVIRALFEQLLPRIQELIGKLNVGDDVLKAYEELRNRLEAGEDGIELFDYLKKL